MKLPLQRFVRSQSILSRRRRFLFSFWVEAYIWGGNNMAIAGSPKRPAAPASGVSHPSRRGCGLATAMLVLLLLLAVAATTMGSNNGGGRAADPPPTAAGTPPLAPASRRLRARGDEADEPSITGRGGGGGSGTRADPPNQVDRSAAPAPTTTTAAAISPPALTEAQPPQPRVGTTTSTTDDAMPTPDSDPGGPAPVGPAAASRGCPFATYTGTVGMDSVSTPVTRSKLYQEHVVNSDSMIRA